MKKCVLVSLAALIFITGCQKEKSFETPNVPSEGSLTSEASGDCLPKTVNGIYEAGVALVPTTNSISVDVEVTKAGSYLITSDTVNGFFFRSTGVFTSIGTITVELRGNGTAFAAGVNNFVIAYNGTVCDVQVTVLPAGSTGPAAFTLVSSGTPALCGTPVIGGTYIKDVNLNPSSNTVTLKVNTTTAGIYNVTTTATNGMTFTGTGPLALGAGTIVLKGSGKPGTAGTTTVTVTAGASTCAFDIPVVAGAEFSINCGGATINGTYQAGTPLVAGNTVVLPITVVTPGAYTITTTAVNGMTFKSEGTVTAASTSITLTGSGTPAASGTSTISVSFGASTCTFNVPVVAGTVVINWECTVGGVLRKGTTAPAILSTTGGLNQLIVQGDQDDGIGTMGITMNNVAGAISTGTYSGTALTGKFASFVYTDGTLAWIAAPTMGTNLVVELTVFNTTTKQVEGTFSGTVKDETSAIVPLTGGKFKATLQ